jgi:hypothetical protein
VLARRARALPALLLTLLSLLGAAGCTSEPPAPGNRADDASPSAGDGDGAGAVTDAGAEPTYQPTYSAVWDEILSPRCALPFCHGGSGDYLQLSSKEIGYSSLVGTPAAGPDCGATGLLRVDPGDPDASLLYLKVTSPPCGSKMPIEYGAPEYLDSRQTTQIHDWIGAGAHNN